MTIEDEAELDVTMPTQTECEGEEANRMSLDYIKSE